MRVRSLAYASRQQCSPPATLFVRSPKSRHRHKCAMQKNGRFIPVMVYFRRRGFRSRGFLRRALLPLDFFDRRVSRCVAKIERAASEVTCKKRHFLFLSYNFDVLVGGGLECTLLFGRGLPKHIKDRRKCAPEAITPPQ